MNERTEPHPVLVTPAIEIRVDFNPDGTRAFLMRFAPLPLDTNAKELNEVLDRVLTAIERQRAKFEMADEKALLATQLDRIRKYESGIVTLDESGKNWWEAEGRRGDWDIGKLSPNAKNERERLQIALQNDRRDATVRQGRIQRLEQQVNGHAPDFSADSHPG